MEENLKVARNKEIFFFFIVIIDFKIYINTVANETEFFFEKRKIIGKLNKKNFVLCSLFQNFNRNSNLFYFAERKKYFSFHCFSILLK